MNKQLKHKYKYKLQNAFYQFSLLHADNISNKYIRIKKKKNIPQ